MITSDLKMGVDPTPETLCISSVPQTMHSVQHTILTSYLQSSLPSFHLVCQAT
jgi:hypothetical protein